MSDIAFIGDRDTVMGFKGLGVTVFPTEEWETQPSHLKARLGEIIAAGFKIILVTEDVALRHGTLLAQLLEGRSLPVVLPLPNNRGSQGLGIEKMRRLAEKAIGTDILAKQ